MDAITAELFKQGLGYVLFLGALAVAYLKDKQLLAEKDKNAASMEKLAELFTGTARDLLNGYGNLQKSIDALTSIITSNKP
jgi:hypothetical protein